MEMEAPAYSVLVAAKYVVGLKPALLVHKDITWISKHKFLYARLVLLIAVAASQLISALHVVTATIFLTGNAFLVVQLVLFVQELTNAQAVRDPTIIIKEFASCAHNLVRNVQALLFVQVALRQATPSLREVA